MKSYYKEGLCLMTDDNKITIRRKYGWMFDRRYDLEPTAKRSFSHDGLVFDVLKMVLSDSVPAWYELHYEYFCAGGVAVTGHHKFKWVAYCHGLTAAFETYAEAIACLRLTIEGLIGMNIDLSGDVHNDDIESCFIESLKMHTGTNKVIT